MFAFDHIDQNIFAAQRNYALTDLYEVNGSFGNYRPALKNLICHNLDFVLNQQRLWMKNIGFQSYNLCFII